MNDLLALGGMAAAAPFLNRIAAVPAKEIGEMLADRVRTFRVERQIDLLNRTQARLKALGVEPRQVALKTLFPLLEHAGLEEDPDMQERWVGLLSCATNPRNSVLPPSFPDLLAKMSPIEARVLDAVYAVIAPLNLRPDEATMRGARTENIPKVLGISDADATVAIENLIRMSLVATPAASFEFVDNKHHRYQIQNRDILCGTPLGWAFVAACEARTAPGDEKLGVGEEIVHGENLDARSLDRTLGTLLRTE